MGYKAVFDKKRKFGIEIECFGIDRYELQHTLTEWGIQSKIELYESPNTYWTIGDDGSIEGKDPIELRSPILCGLEGLAEVKRVLTLLNYLEAQVNASCGLHVHWSVPDYSGVSTLALLRLYAKFESVLDGLVAVSRRGDSNIHCRSLLKDDNLEWISNLDKSGEARAIEVVLKYSNIYRGRKDKVSLCAYLKFGTIEFRHHESSTDPDEIQGWILLTQALVNRAKQASVSKEMSSSPTLSELLRVLGMTEYQGCTDTIALETKTWMQNKYSSMRKKKSVTNKILA